MFSSPEDLVRVTSRQSSANVASNTHISNRSPSARGNGLTSGSASNGLESSTNTSKGITDVSIRRALMDRLQAYLPADIMLPPKRLMTLLNQAAEFQTERCLYHNKSVSVNHIFDIATNSDVTMASSGALPLYTI